MRHANQPGREDLVTQTLPSRFSHPFILHILSALQHLRLVLGIVLTGRARPPRLLRADAAPLHRPPPAGPSFLPTTAIQGVAATLVYRSVALNCILQAERKTLPSLVSLVGRALADKCLGQVVHGVDPVLGILGRASRPRHLRQASGLRPSIAFYSSLFWLHNPHLGVCYPCKMLASFCTCCSQGRFSCAPAHSSRIVVPIQPPTHSLSQLHSTDLVC